MSSSSSSSDSFSSLGIILTSVLLVASPAWSAAASDPFSRNKPFYDSSYVNVDHVVLSAAICKASCYQKCLEMHPNVSDSATQMQQDSTIVHSPTSRIEQQCKKTHEVFITSCTAACEFSRTSGTISKDCSDQCQGDKDGCVEGCQFLSNAIKMSLGNCPEKPEVDKLLDRECHLDQQCMIEGDVRKCCNLRCVVPTFHSKIGPALWPPSIMEGKDGSSFEMTWKFDDAALPDPGMPILYVLQVRTYFNKDFESAKASHWKTLLITFREGVNLHDLQPGMLYQFRVASVTKYGTSGFKSVSTPVRLTRTPGNPGVPRNLTDGAWRLQANGKINIRLHWMEPIAGDIPISEYKISWVRDHGFTQPDGQSLEALTDFVQTVPGTQRSYDIEGLVADKTYKVQVRAISKWGSAALTSTPNTIFLTTPQLPARESERIVAKDSFIPDNQCTCPEGPQDSGIKFGTPYYNKNSLKVDLFIANSRDQFVYKVSYAPNVCIDTESSPVVLNHIQTSSSGNADIYRERSITAPLPNATLGPLQFSCRYTIQVQPLRFRPSNRWIKKQIHFDEDQHLLTSCFCTPSCLKLLSQPQYFATDLKCPNKASPTLDPPNKLLFQRSQKNPESFLVFWDYSTNERRDSLNPSNFRYRVIWGPSIDDHVDRNFIQAGEDQLLMPRLDMSQAETKVLKENVSSIWLENLKKNTFYIVQVQAIFYQQDVEQISKTKIIVLSTHKDPSFQKLAVFEKPFSGAHYQLGAHCVILALLVTFWRLST